MAVIPGAMLVVGDDAHDEQDDHNLSASRPPLNRGSKSVTSDQSPALYMLSGQPYVPNCPTRRRFRNLSDSDEAAHGRRHHLVARGNILSNKHYRPLVQGVASSV